MKKPGQQKRKTPGGGAAGRAYQFESQRDVEKPSAGQPSKNASKRSASKKTTKKKSST